MTSLAAEQEKANAIPRYEEPDFEEEREEEDVPCCGLCEHCHAIDDMACNRIMNEVSYLRFMEPLSRRALRKSMAHTLMRFGFCDMMGELVHLADSPCDDMEA